jgi:hypothetical protein
VKYDLALCCESWEKWVLQLLLLDCWGSWHVPHVQLNMLMYHTVTPGGSTFWLFELVLWNLLMASRLFRQLSILLAHNIILFPFCYFRLSIWHTIRVFDEIPNRMHVRLYYVVFSDIKKIIAQIRAEGWVSFACIYQIIAIFQSC